MSAEKILITGATGYVGAGLHRDLSRSYETIGTFYSTSPDQGFIRLDTTSRDEVQRVLEKTGATTIIHAAGKGNLQWCQEHPQEARRLNEEATKNIIAAANKVAAGVIFISSFAALNPNNIYAETKANSEQLVKNLANRGTVIRPTVVVGLSPNTINDKLMNRILRNIEDGTPAIYDNTWQIQPTDLTHLSQIISAVIDKRLDGHTIPVVTERLSTYFDMAKDVLQEFGIPVTPVEGPYYPPETDDRSKLRELGLPLVEYQQMIEKTVEDIKRDFLK
jgi:dTDP-4-dehydrorhamnose reductase